MTDDVLLRTVLPSLCSATQGTFAVKDQSCEGKRANSFLLAFCSFINSFFRFLVPWFLRLKWWLSVFVNTAKVKYAHMSFSLLLRRIVVDSEMYKM